MTATIGSLCSGYGGLDEGLRLALGGGRVLWHAEYDDAPAKILAAHYPDVPNLRDITTTDWSQVEPVDVLTAGYPCQPFSQAGKRKGAADERHLWPYVAGAVRVLRPRLVVLENVAGHVSLGLDRVLADLAAMGYVGRWGVLRAADAGAPHNRARIFIVAADASGERHGRGEDRRGVGRLDGEDAGGAREWERPRAVAGDRSGEAIGDAHSLARNAPSAFGGRRGPVDQPGAGERTVGPDRAPVPHADDLSGARDWPIGRSEERPASSGSSAADSDRWGCEGRSQLDSDSAQNPADGSPRREHADRRSGTDWGQYAGAIARWERILGRPAPAPTEPGRAGQRLSPRFVEWLMGLPDGWVCDIPGLSRSAQLKALGNGVVPQQAALAVRTLLNVEAVAA